MMFRETLIIVFCSVVHTAIGFRSYRHQIPNGNNVPNPCGGTWDAVGHTDPINPNHGKSAFGEAFKRNEFRWTIALCREDSDGDGLTNGHELGDPNCQWQFNGVPVDRFGEGATGNPGMCEPGRQCQHPRYKVRCPSRPARPVGPSGTQQWPFSSANDHPQNFLSKQMSSRPGPAGIRPDGMVGAAPRRQPSLPQSVSQDGGAMFQGRGAMLQGGGAMLQGGGAMSPDGGSMSSGGIGIPNTHFRAGASHTWQPNRFPSRERFAESLQQSNIQGSGMLQGFAPAMPPPRQEFASGQNIQAQVQARLQRERMSIPSSGTMWSMGNSGGTRMVSPFRSDTFAPMAPMGFVLNRVGGAGFMMPSGMGYPMF